MYSKVYSITCDTGKADALLAHYDAVVAPAVRASGHHVGHQMIQTANERWILTSNYTSAQAAQDALPMVQELVGEMAQKFGMNIETLGEGETLRHVE